MISTGFGPTYFGLYYPAGEGITYSNLDGTDALPLWAQQTLTSSDTTPGAYSIVIMFTAQFTY